MDFGSVLKHEDGALSICVSIVSRLPKCNLRNVEIFETQASQCILLIGCCYLGNSQVGYEKNCCIFMGGAMVIVSSLYLIGSLGSWQVVRRLVLVVALAHARQNPNP